jgi:hypothetical protein
MRALLTTVSMFLVQEFYRPRPSRRHQRPDPLSGFTVPTSFGVPNWLPTATGPLTPAEARAHKRVTEAREDCDSAREAWYRGFLDDGSYRASIRTLHEAEQEASR